MFQSVKMMKAHYRNCCLVWLIWKKKTVRKLSIAEFWEILNDVLLPAESEVIKLFYLDNLTVSKIAEHTGDTEQQIRQLQQQALKKLRMRKKIKEII